MIVYLLLILMVITWSFSFVFVDIALEFISPMPLALYRFVIVSLVFFIIDIFFKIRQRTKSNESSTVKFIDFSRYSKKDWFYILLASIFGVSLFFSLQYNSIALIGPSIPALFVCLLAPVFITILALFSFNEKLTIIKIIGFIIASIGAFFLITGGDLSTLAPSSPNFIGYLFALLTPLIWSVYTIFTKKLNLKHPDSNLHILKLIAYLGMVELLIFVILGGEFMNFLQNLLNPIVFFCALYLGIACYLFGYYAWQRSQKELKSSKGASFLYVEPFLTLLFSFLLQRTDIIMLGNILGGVIVLVAVLIINYK